MPRISKVTDRNLFELLGQHVQKTQDLASDPDELFTVTGTVLINLLYGQVTVVVATTTTLLLERKTSNVAMCAATTITTDAVGTMYYFTGDAGAILSGTLGNGDAPVVGLAHTAGGPVVPMIFGLAPGDVAATETIQAQLDGAGTGNIQWDLWYIPLSPGAKVVAAA